MEVLRSLKINSTNQRNIINFILSAHKDAKLIRTEYGKAIVYDTTMWLFIKDSITSFSQLQFKQKYPDIETLHLEAGFNIRTTTSSSDYRKLYPEKINAHRALKNAHDNKLDKKNYFHHWSYREEHKKDVIELTPSQHGTIHDFLKYDQKNLMYRGLSFINGGELLDSKEKHIDYFLACMQKRLLSCEKALKGHQRMRQSGQFYKVPNGNEYDLDIWIEKDKKDIAFYSEMISDIKRRNKIKL